MQTYLLTSDGEKAKEALMKFYDDFNDNEPVNYESGKVDCQTCTHHMIYLILGNSIQSPHDENTLGWQEDGSMSPHDISKRAALECS